MGLESIYLIIILLAIFFDYFLASILSVLTIRSLDPALPDEFSDIYNSDSYARSQSYTKDKTRISIISSTISFFIGLSVIYFNLFNILDIYVRSFGYTSDIVNGLIFFALIAIISDMISMPFSVYNTFVIEERYGFNKMSISLFITDRLKGYVISMVIGAPVISLLIFFFNIEGAWIYAWIFMAFFSLAMQPIFTTFIAPLFNKFSPIQEGPLRDKIHRYFDKVDFPVSKIEMMDGSKRSGHANAYFSGIGRTKRIAIFDTLLNNQSDDEVLAVIAHEVGHYKLKHITKGIVMGLLQSGAMLFLLSLFINNEPLSRVFGMDNLSVYTSFIFFSMLYSPIGMVLDFIGSYISRKHEFEADKYSAETTGLPENLISSLKNLSVDNLSNLTPHWFNVFINYSHPPVLERIRALKELQIASSESGGAYGP